VAPCHTRPMTSLPQTMRRGASAIAIALASREPRRVVANAKPRAELPSNLALARGIPAGEAVAPVGDDSTSWNMILPAGKVLSLRDDREYKNSNPEMLATEYNADEIKIAVDINHDSVLFDFDPPSNGWVEEMEVREGAIWGRIEWTDIGQELLSRRHYRYLSPAFQFDEETMEILGFASVALVNQPAMTMPAVASRVPAVPATATAKSKSSDDPNPTTETESLMNEEQLKALRASLGLAEDAPIEDVLAAASAAKADPVEDEDTPSVDDPDNEQDDVVVDLSKYVPRADYDAVVDKLEEVEGGDNAATDTVEVEAIVDQAIAAARIAPNSRKQYIAMCSTTKGLENFKEMARIAPKVVATSPDKRIATAARQGDGPTAEQVKVATAMGLKPEALTTKEKSNA